MFLIIFITVRLFKENPEYQSLFKRLKNLSIDELATNPHFMSHASKVGAALASTIDHLDKPEELEKLLTNLGIKHKKYGLSAKHFQVNEYLLLKYYLKLNKPKGLKQNILYSFFKL